MEVGFRELNYIFYGDFGKFSLGIESVPRDDKQFNVLFNWNSITPVTQVIGCRHAKRVHFSSTPPRLYRITWQYAYRLVRISN